MYKLIVCGVLTGQVDQSTRRRVIELNALDKIVTDQLYRQNGTE